MLRAFIVFAEIVVLIIVLRSSFAQYLFSDAQRVVSGWFVTLAEMPEQNELEALRETVKQRLPPLRPYQDAYLSTITVNKATLKRFNTKYCDGNDINPNFTGTSRAQLCLIIKQSPLLARND